MAQPTIRKPVYTTQECHSLHEKSVCRHRRTLMVALLSLRLLCGNGDATCDACGTMLDNARDAMHHASELDSLEDETARKRHMVVHTAHNGTIGIVYTLGESGNVVIVSVE